MYPTPLKDCTPMPLVFELTTPSLVPIQVQGLLPKLLQGQSNSAICSLPIGLGNESAAVGDLFRVSGNCDDEGIIFRGELKNVHGIGFELSEGRITIEGSSGRHVGASMSGGELTVHGDVGDFTGYEMQGGCLHVIGNAGDRVGGCYPGAAVGMNRGMICVTGNVGNGLGQRMRRGTIVVGGDAGDLTAWQMRAGSIIVGGHCEGRIGVDMKRGTIVTGSSQRNIDSSLGATFSRGMTGRFPAIDMLMRWTVNHVTKFKLPVRKFTPAQVTNDELTCWHGDALAGGRGEIFSHSSAVTHSSALGVAR